MRINSKILLAVAVMPLLFTATAKAELNVIACEAEYGALAKAIAPSADVY